MALSKHTKSFVDSQIDYYINEASSYKQIAEQYVPEIESVSDTALELLQAVYILDFCKHMLTKNKFLVWKIFKNLLKF